MYDIVTYGYGSVENSITNNNTVPGNQLDLSQPFTYYDFLKNTRGFNTAVDYNDGYLNYLNNWYTSQGETPTAVQQLIANQYINLIRDINLNYTTNEEKRFLQNIDFNSKEDLQIVIPFYSRKLKDIILHIRDKREEVKYVIDVNSIKGSNKSLEKAIFETITQTILGDSTYNVSLSAVTNDMEIEIEEFIDTYSKYFNVPPTADNEPESRERFYSANSNVIDGDLFINFDQKLKDSIFKNTFLTELGTNFSVNVDITSLISCNPNDEFRSQITSQCAGGITIEDRLNLQKQLIQKYIGVDYYYLSSNSLGQTVSGMLFRADNPSGHLLNTRNSSTQSIPSDQLTSLRQFGMYFTPDKTGILRFNTKTKKHSFDLSVVESNTTYIFPDPEVCGNVYYNGETPVVYTITYEDDIANISKTFTAGDPRVDRQDQSYFGYYSKQQDIQINPVDRFNVDLVSLYNEGYIQEWRQDIFGNQYGLFKSKFQDYFRTFEDSNDVYIKDLLLNGGDFFDNIEGYTNNSDFTPFTGVFSSYAVDYYLTLRQFTPYAEFEDIGATTTYQFTLKDGGLFTFLDGSPLPDGISSDSISLPSVIVPGYYYRTLTDGGLNISYTRALTGSGASYEGTFISSPNHILSSGESFDGGSFDVDNSIHGGYEYGEGRYFINELLPGAETIISTLSSYGNSEHDIQSVKDQLGGRLVVGDYMTGYVYPLSSTYALYNTFKKYNQDVQNSVFHGDIITFNVFYDCIQLQTGDYFVVDKIVYDSDGFATPHTINTYHSLSADNVSITNPFYVNGKVYYCVLTLERTGDTQYVIPTFYSYSVSNNTEHVEFPNASTTFNELSSNFTLTQVSSADWFSKVITPRLTYNSRNMVFGLSFLSYNQNNSPYVFDYKIEGINKEFKLIDQRVYQPSNTSGIYSNTLNLTAIPAEVLGSGLTITGGSFKL